MKFLSNRKKYNSTEINMTPLIDIIFQLLIFFMITSTFSQAQGIDVDLAKASNAKVLKNDNPIKIIITKNGRILYKEKVLSLDELKEMLQTYYKKNKDKILLLQSDAQTPHGKVISTMDIAKSIGFKKLVMATNTN